MKQREEFDGWTMSGWMVRAKHDWHFSQARDVCFSGRQTTSSLFLHLVHWTVTFSRLRRRVPTLLLRLSSISLISVPLLVGRRNSVSMESSSSVSSDSLFVSSSSLDLLSEPFSSLSDTHWKEKRKYKTDTSNSWEVVTVNCQAIVQSLMRLIVKLSCKVFFSQYNCS